MSYGPGKPARPPKLEAVKSVALTVEDSAYESRVALAARGVSLDRGGADLVQEGIKARARLEIKIVLAELQDQPSNAPSDAKITVGEQKAMGEEQRESSVTSFSLPF